MLICKYTRRGNAAFVPHLDMLRTVTMAIRRIGAEVAYSEGFNPHMKIFFGQPLPIGTESDCEYFCLHSNEDPAKFMAAVNGSLPAGVAITAAAATEKDPNVANLMCFADYTVTMRSIEPNLGAAESFVSLPECTVRYTAKGKEQQKDVKTLIADLRVPDAQTIRMRLRCGNTNLRADRVMPELCRRYGLTGGYDIVKTAMYDCGGTDLDTILFGSTH